MKSRSRPLIHLRNWAVLKAVASRRAYLMRAYGMQIGEQSKISMTAKMDKTNPAGVVIGSFTRITLGVTILTHDFVNAEHRTTRIGSNCFLGAMTIVLPGVSIGDHCVVGAGSVVTKDVPTGSVVAGNPARVIRSGVQTGPWGMMHPDMLPGGRAVPPGWQPCAQ